MPVEIPIRFTTAALLCASYVMLATAPCVAVNGLASFSSPTGNIGCYLSTYNPPEVVLRCDVRDGLVPLPPRQKGLRECHWGVGYRMNPTGRPEVVCASDSALGAPGVLKYGAQWSSHGITCDSKRTGITCTNRSGHGFMLAKGEAHAF